MVFQTVRRITKTKYMSISPHCKEKIKKRLRNCPVMFKAEILCAIKTSPKAVGPFEVG
jgi:hypothetical protein